MGRMPLYSPRMDAAIGQLETAGVERTPRLPRLSTGWVGAVLLVLIGLPCLVTVPYTLKHYEGSSGDEAGADVAPSLESPASLLGTDALGRSLLYRCLLGGAISLAVGITAALIAVCIGVTWGALAGYVGGLTDAFMMRTVDVLYGLPYILLVVLMSMAVAGLVDRIELADARAAQAAAEAGAAHSQGVLAWLVGEYSVLIRLLTLAFAIGSVSWLTMARVIRGQVLSLRAQPFMEAARAYGVGPWRVMTQHLLPNLVGPIVVYTTLAVPSAILQESFLSFLGIGVQAPLPSWGNLAAEGVAEFPELSIPGFDMEWWLLVFPCVLLGLTLMALNFVGDALRDRFDPKRQAT